MIPYIEAGVPGEWGAAAVQREVARRPEQRIFDVTQSESDDKEASPMGHSRVADRGEERDGPHRPRARPREHRIVEQLAHSTNGYVTTPNAKNGVWRDLCHKPQFLLLERGEDPADSPPPCASTKYSKL